MKVKELIEELNKYDPEQMVVLPGYEGGYYDSFNIEVIKIELNYHDKDSWWYGPHEEVDDYKNTNGIEVIRLG